MPYASIYPLGSKARDIVTGLKGTITLAQFGIGGILWYRIQPKGLDKNKIPLEGIWISAGQIECNKSFVRVEVPYVLGTKVTDDVTGATGICSAVILHLSGCLHVDIQPQGTDADGKVFLPWNTDIRRCSGPAIKKLTAAARKKSETRNPSPTSGGSYRHP